MEKRWTIFLLITIAVYLFFMSVISKQKKETEAGGREKQTQEVVETGDKPPSGRQTPEPTPRERTQPSKNEAGEEVPVPEEPEKEEEFISISTELFDVELTNRGGRPNRWKLLVDKPVPTEAGEISDSISLIEPLNQQKDRELPLEIHFREYNARQSYSILNRKIFDYEKIEHSGGDVEVVFTSPEIDGIYVIKRYYFPVDSHLVDFSVKIHNTTESRIVLNDEGRGLGVSWGPGLGAYKDVNDTYQKRYSRSLYSVKEGETKGFKPSDDKEEVTAEIRWAGQNTRFMLATIIPQEEPGVAFESVARTKNLLDYKGEKQDFSILPATATLWLDEINLSPGEDREFDFKVFIGPRKYSLLKEANYGLADAMFFTHWNWMQGLCIILLHILQWMHGLLKNYGLAIIGLTLVVRIATYPLTHKGMKLQAKAMAEQAKIKPMMEEINEKYKDNPQLKNKKVMELYREHGINPLGFLRGCLPLLIQMPIFISLYFLLSESFELRGSSFLWIKDLSSPDRLFDMGTSLPIVGRYFNLLPILMGLSQLAVSRFTTTASVDPNQKKMMYFFPLFFMFILYNLSSGLILYWLVSNLLQAGQQFFINKHMKKDQPADKAA